MKLLRFLGLLLLAAAAFLGLFLLYSTLTYYNPDPITPIAEYDKSDTIPCDSSFSVLSWNIGYAGLGDNMDFFYDGGKRVRDSYKRTLTNLDSISNFLKNNHSNSFFLLQEVDLKSKRSYSINEGDTLASRISYLYSFAPNYIVRFVPIPIKSPMGSVYSGVMTFSKFMPISSIRYSYPGSFGWPNKLFNLRRCILVNRYPTSNGKEFILINSHKSAFDDGSLKKQEMDFLCNLISYEYSKGNYVIVGGDWNQCPPDLPLDTFGKNFKVDFFKLTNIEEKFTPKGWKWVYDPSHPTNRYLNASFDQSKTFCSILDFFLVSPNIEVVKNQTYDLAFRYSDHNPTSLIFKLISK